jgi:hypothetical protein
MLTWDDLDEPNYLPLAQHYLIIRRNRAVVPFEASKTPAALVMQALGLMLGANRKLTSGNLVNLFKQGRQALKSQTGKLNGFFSASKANLRNAP